MKTEKTVDIKSNKILLLHVIGEHGVLTIWTC